jgi:TolB protein
MIRRLLTVILSLAALLSCGSVLLAQSDIEINIHEPGMSRIKIGVPPFSSDPAASPAGKLLTGEEIAEIICEDLDFSGLFQVYPSPPLQSQSGAGAPLKAWLPLGVQAVAQGGYKQLSDYVTLEAALFDVESETRIFGRFYKGNQREGRLIAHSFADEIVYRYTGKRGIATTSIAYVKRKGANKEIHIMDYDGRNSYQLTHDNSIALSPRWAPDGGKVVFTSYRDRNPDVYVVDPKARSYVRLSGYIGLNTTPAFSPDGRTLALTLSKDGNPEVYLLDMKNKGLTKLTRNPKVDTSPTWSPNGREIAFVSDRSGSPQVYITDREGVNLRRLTYSGSYNTSPVWSPTGDKIAYVSSVGARGDIYAISPTGGEPARLTVSGGNEDPTWSPDGRYLAYSSKVGGRRDIYLMRADGSGTKRVTSGGGDCMSPAWSP